MEKCYLYIVLTRTNTVISRLIQFSKHDEYTHASISLDRELKHMYSFGRRTTYNPLIGRFRRENLNEGVYRLCRRLPGVIIELEVSKEQYEKVRTVLGEFISNSARYKYNYKGLLYSLLNKPMCCENRFLCSEFVYYVLKESGIVDLKVSRNLVRPQTLLNLKGRIIYVGDLKKMDLSDDQYPELFLVHHG